MIGITPGLSSATIDLCIYTSYIDLVVPGEVLTTHGFDFLNALMMLDFPTFGNPTIPTVRIGFSSVFITRAVFLKIFIKCSIIFSLGSKFAASPFLRFSFISFDLFYDGPR